MLGSGARPHKRSKVPSLSPFVWDQDTCCYHLRPTRHPLPRVMPLLLFPLFPLFTLAPSHLPTHIFHIPYTATTDFPRLTLSHHPHTPGA